MVKFIQNDIVCFLKKSGEFRIMCSFLCNGCKNMFCNRLGIAAVELKLPRRYEMFVQSLGKFDIYDPSSGEGENCV